MKSKSPVHIYQSKKGITLLDGFYLVKNPKTQKINVVSISNNVVYIHDVTRSMTLQDLVTWEAIGTLEVFEALKMEEKEKSGKNKQ